MSSLSIFTSMTDPEARGDAWKEALECYNDLADEVVIVGDDWEYEFSWEYIGEVFQEGFDLCTGDWVIHADLDFLFHEDNIKNIRDVLKRYSNAPAVSFWKYQFILPDRYNLKSRLIIAVNKKKFGKRIKFDGGGESDLCQPSLDAKLITPDQVPEARIPFFNYEKLTKTKEQVMEDVARMDRAYNRHYGKYLYSKDGTDESAFDGWIKMEKGRFNKPQQHIPLNSHPKYIRDTIKNLSKEQFGYSGFGELEVNDYAKN